MAAASAEKGGHVHRETLTYDTMRDRSRAAIDLEYDRWKFERLLGRVSAVLAALWLGAIVTFYVL